MDLKLAFDLLIGIACIASVVGGYIAMRRREAKPLDVLLLGVPAALAVYGTYWLYAKTQAGGGESGAYERLLALLLLLGVAPLAVLLSLLTLTALVMALASSERLRSILLGAAVLLVALFALFSLLPPMIAASLILVAGIAVKPLGRPLRFALLVVGGTVLGIYPLTSRFGHWSLGGDGQPAGYRVGIVKKQDGEEWALENAPSSIEACDSASKDTQFRAGCRQQFQKLGGMKGLTRQTEKVEPHAPDRRTE